MIRCTFLTRGLLALLVGAVCESAYSKDPTSSTTVQLDGATYNVVLADDVQPGDAIPLPENLPLQRVFVGKNGTTVTAGITGVEVYRSVNGSIFAPVGANGLIADDIQTTAANGCGMSYLELAIFGGGDGSGPGFNVTQLRIFDDCPGQGGQLVVDLLDGTPISLPNNGGFLLTFDLEEELVAIQSSFWLGMAFSTGTAGWIGGAAPTIGSSLNIIDVPAIRCNAVFSNVNLYASMYADIFCANAETFFVGYKSEAPSGIFFGGGGCVSPATLGGCGDGINLNVNCETAADDIMPIVPNCQLRGYTVNVAGLGGTFEMEFELWTDDPSVATTGAPLAPIPGTRGCYQGTGNGFLEQAAFVFDGSVTLPPKFWLVWADNDNDAGPIESGAPAEIGFSGDFFGIFDMLVNPPAWDPNFFFNGCTDGDDDACGSFHITVQCLGEEPTGACCDGLAGSCTENMLIGECGPSNRWQPSVTCAAASFNPPCGTTACCKVDPKDAEMTICENDNPTLCAADGGDPTPGQFCETVECGSPGCIAATGDCLAEHETGGCVNNVCCNMVCDIDAFCCNNMWDETCVGTAIQVCPPQAPVNDNRSDAIEIQMGTTGFSTLSATTDGPALPQQCISGGSLVIGSDIWYEFNSLSDGILNIDLCTGTDYDSRIALYDGCISAPNVVVGCDDDGCDPEPGTDPVILTSRSMVPVMANHCYLLRVGGWGEGESGTGLINLTKDTEACPTSGAVAYVDPPSGVVDARQPHSLTSMTPRQGIRTFSVNAPTATNPIMCFDICETDDEGNPNTIATVLDPPGSYEITLNRTIAVGAVTTLNYSATNATGTFISHPGNVNGNAVAGADDVMSMMTCLQTSIPNADCPFGLYSVDADQNGARSVLDLARLLDLLNGAGLHIVWNNTQKPGSTGCP